MAEPKLIIDASDLCKSFGSKPAVINAALQVAEGEIFGFLGPNGAGKTTTIRMLCGLLTPDQGKGTCLGYDLLKESALIKRQVGYMTQHFSLYKDLTIRENLDFIARLYKVKNRRQAVTKSIEQLGLIHRQHQLAGALSGGWKQRLALSAALIHCPKLLLLDEPTAGVDPKARREFWAHIQYLATEGVTTLVSTHYMDEAERCTKLAYIFNGRIMAQGTAEQIIAGSKLYTWQVVGSGNLMELAQKLKSVPGVEQAAAFGAKLHVSGSGEAKLAQAMQALESATWKVKQIAPGLEDVFINLCGEEDERFKE